MMHLKVLVCCAHSERYLVDLDETQEGLDNARSVVCLNNGTKGLRKRVVDGLRWF